MTEHAPTSEASGRLVRLAYRGVLRREPTQAELEQAMHSLAAAEQTPADLLEQLIGRQDFGIAALRRPGGSDRGALQRAAPEVVATTASLTACEAIDREQFERLWHERFHVQLAPGPAEDALREYGADHQQRFWETANALRTLLGDRPNPRLLDFGVSVFVWFYRHLLPGVELVTSDRPVDAAQHTFFERVCADAGGSRHVPLDLTDPSAWTEDIRTAFGRFDAIVLTEVLEHVTVHPVQVLRPTLQLLRPDGFLYITTPNCFSRSKLGMILHRHHPQPVYPMTGNADGAHHFREGAMGELLEFVEEAGGEIRAFYWSDCWDRANDPDLQPLEERSNLVVVASPRRGR